MHSVVMNRDALVAFLRIRGLLDAEMSAVLQLLQDDGFWRTADGEVIVIAGDYGAYSVFRKHGSPPLRILRPFRIPREDDE